MTDSLNEAVLVLKSLPKNEAAKIMSKLDIKDIRKVMQSSDKIGDRSEQDVLNALSRLSVEAGAISQKSGQTKQIASEKITSGPEQPKPSPSNILERSRKGPNPFQFLLALPVETQEQLLIDEHPENIALIVTYLPPEVGAKILKPMKDSSRIAVLRRLCLPINPEEQHVTGLASSLRSRLEQMQNPIEASTGVERAARILSCSEIESQEAVLSQLNEVEPGLGEEIQSTLLRFEDLQDFEDLDVQILLKNVDTSCWAPALKATSESVRKKVMDNMAEEVAKILGDQIDEIQSVDNDQASQAQSEVINACIQLAEQGKIVLPQKSVSETE